MNFGPYPEKRELPSFVQKQSGEELALKLLRQHDALDALHRKELSDVQKQADRLAEQLALLVHKKRFTENDPFVMSLRQLLKNEGIILRTYVGEEVTDTLEDEADIVEWLPPGEDTVDRVEDALEPEILWHGQLLHRAKLSCRQAAEEAGEDVAEETGAQDQAAPSGTAETEDAEESSIEEPAESSEETAGAAAELAEAAEETASEEPEEMPEEAAGAAEEAAETAEAAEEPAGDSIDDESQAAEPDENSYVDEDSYDGADSGEEEYFDDEGDFDEDEYFDDEGDSGEEEYFDDEEDSDDEEDFDDGKDIDDEENFDDEEDQEEAGFFRRILDRISSWLSGES